MSRDWKLWLWGVLCAYAGIAAMDGAWIVFVMLAVASFAVMSWAGDPPPPAVEQP